VLLAVAAWATVTMAAVVLLRWVNPPTTAFMIRDRASALFSGDDGYEFRHEWRDWGQIS